VCVCVCVCVCVKRRQSPPLLNHCQVIMPLEEGVMILCQFPIFFVVNGERDQKHQNICDVIYVMPLTNPFSTFSISILLYVTMSWADSIFLLLLSAHFPRDMSIKIGFQFILSRQYKICFSLRKKETYLVWRKKSKEKKKSKQNLRKIVFETYRSS
jgi:hypothetical protein